ncbi:MAG: HutD family protein [Caulobacter sp.]
MRLLPAADRTPSPWKNGGGTTWEIAAQPPGADLSSFDWRLSIARVAAPGPFSVFPGIDRVLTLIDGAGLRLTIEGAGEVVLDAAAAPLPFPGDAPASATLDSGPIRDLNLMVRRGAWLGSVRRIDGAETIIAQARVTVLVAQGPATVNGRALAAEDAVLVEGDATLTVDGRLLLIGIDPA